MNPGYRILAQGHTVSNDTWKTGINNNDCIIGPSGCGKTRGYVAPNILQCTESMIIADSKGALRQAVGKTLERNGYEVLEIDLKDCVHSPCGYDPLRYIRYDRQMGHYNEQDIMTVAAAIVPVENGQEAFWDLFARMFMASMISYVLEYLPEEEHVMPSVVRLFGEMGNGNFDRIFKELNQIAPYSFSATLYRMYQTSRSADKMYSSVQGVLAEKLVLFVFDGAKRLSTNPVQIDLPSLGRKKTAVFLSISDTDDTMNRLVSLFYAQALHILCDCADRNEGHRLDVPVRFYLDDFAAATDACIPGFDGITSVIRSREISVSIILQSLSQLEASYGPARAATILNNCDNLLYLGGQDVETARYISVKANKSIHTVLNMPLDSAWLFTRGNAPQEVAKFRLQEHPKYKELPEYKAQHRKARKKPPVQTAGRDRADDGPGTELQQVS